jgi:hypothetical protein
MVSKLSEIDPGFSSRIRIPDPDPDFFIHPGSWVKKTPDLRSGSATLAFLEKGTWFDIHREQLTPSS